MKKLWTSPFVLFLREAIMLYFSRRVPQAAACLAYFVLLTVFPVLICVSYILGMVNIDIVSLMDQLQPLLPEAAVGAALFLMLPGRAFGGKRVMRGETPEFPAALEGMRAQLTRMAAALRALYDSMGRAAPVSTEENPAVVFDRAAEKVCRGCALCELCWQKEYTGTFNALNDATPFLLERGRALAKDFPSYFADRCIHLPDFLTAVNGELSAFLLRRQYRRQLEETRRSARGQYAQLSELLTATAAGLGEVRATAGEADLCRIGAALRPKEGETVCGDTVVSFRTEGGLLCLLLADGMGSGEAARRESALTCRLLEQFLQAGAGGGHEDPERSHGPAGRGDRKLHHH